jgi:pimeloyl-ACP methyl ester carboxylesterase
VFTSLFIPGGSAEQMQWLNDLQRNTTSPENAARIREAMNTIDVTGLLPEVRVPTLVMHCRDDAVVPFEEGRLMAAGIPGAHFVELDGNNHMILDGDPGRQRFLDETLGFLAD